MGILSDAFDEDAPVGPDPLKMNQPPSEDEDTSIGASLGRASKWVQDQLALGKLGQVQDQSKSFFQVPNIGRTAEGLGEAIGALPAWIGAGGFTKAITPWQADPSVTPEVISQATKEGMQAGGQAGKQFTLLDVLGALPGGGVPGKLLAGADAALGTGDVYNAATDKDLTPGERALGGGMGLFRMGMGAFGALHSPKPNLNQAEAAAKAAAGKMAAPPIEPTLDINPAVKPALEGMSNSVLRKVNELAGGSPVQRVVLLDESTITYPTGETAQMTPGQVAEVYGDTIYISKYGQALALQANDVKGVADRFADLISHEVLHPKIDTGRPTGSFDPISGAPVEASAETGSGHFEGGEYDDRLKDPTQIWKEYQLAEQVKADPELHRLAGQAQENGVLNGAFQGAEGAGWMLKGTYSPEMIKFAQELGLRPGLNPAEGGVGMGESPVDAAQMQPLGKAAGKFNKPAEPTEGEFLDPSLVKLVPEPKKPTPALDALLNRRVKPAPVQGAEDLPLLAEYLRRRKEFGTLQGGTMRGGYLPKDYHFNLIQELEDAVKSGRLDAKKARELAGLGGLRDVENNLRAAIAKKYPEGIKNPEGRAWLDRLQKLQNKKPRAFGTDTRTTNIEQGKATPRQEHAIIAGQERDANRMQPMSKKEYKLNQRRQAADERFKASQESRAEAKKGVTDVINMGRQKPTGVERIATWGQAIQDRIARIKTALLSPQERQPIFDTERLVARKTEAAAQKAELGAKGEAAQAKKAAPEKGALGGEIEGPRLRKPKGKAAGAFNKSIEEEITPQQRKIFNEDPEALKAFAKQRAIEITDRMKNISKRGTTPREWNPVEKPAASLGLKWKEAQDKVRAAQGFPYGQRAVGEKLKKSVRRTAKGGKIVAPGKNTDLTAKRKPLTAPKWSQSVKPVRRTENLETVRKYVEKEQEARFKKGVEEAKNAPLPKRFIREPNPMEGQLEKLPEGEVARRARIKAEHQAVPAAAAELPVKEWEQGAKGSFKAAPKKYPTPEAAEPLIKRANAETPRLAEVNRKIQEASKIDSIQSWAEQTAKSGRRWRINSDLLDAYKLGRATRDKVQYAFDAAVRASAEGGARLKAFLSNLDDVKQSLKPEPYEAYKTQRNKTPLLGQLAKAAEEGRISRFIERKGPHGSRRYGTQYYREIPDFDGKTIKDPLLGADAMSKELKTVFGDDKLDAAWVEQNLDKFEPPTKLMDRKAKTVDYGKGATRYSFHEAVHQAAEKLGKTDAPMLKLFPKAEGLPESSYKMKRTVSPKSTFEYPGVKSRSTAGGVPETLNPLKEGRVYPAPRKAGGRFTDDSPPPIKTSGTIAKADLYGKPLGNLNESRVEASIETPRVSGRGEAMTLSDELAQRRYAQAHAKAAEEMFKVHQDKLAAEGRLVTPEQAAKAAKEGYDYPELYSEVADGKRIDYDNEYWVDPKAAKEYRDLHLKRGAEEFNQLREEGQDAATLLQNQAEARREALVGNQKERMQPKEAEPLMSKETRDLVNSHTQRLATAADQIARANAWVAAGKIKASEKGPVLEALRQKELDLQNRSQRSVRTSEKMVPLKGKAAGAFAPQGRKAYTAAELDTLNQRIKKTATPTITNTRFGDWLQHLGESINIGRALVTAFDVSNPLRQTLQLTADQIVQDITRVAKGGFGKGEHSFYDNAKNMMKAFARKDTADALTTALENHPMYDLAKKVGVRFINEMDPAEAWIGKKALDKAIEKAKPLKWAIDGSERAFRFYQNKAMMDAFQQGMEFYNHAAKLDPKRWALTKENMRTLADHINAAASRTQLTNDPKWQKLLNYGLFSSQMLASRAKMLANTATGFSAYSSPISRAYARRQMGRALAGAAAFTGTVFGIGAAAGLKPSLETDWTSTDFGKIKMGNVTFDPGGGWNQIIRVMGQLTTGKQKDKATGLHRPRDAGDTIWNFIRSKAAPGVGLILDVAKGKTWEGDSLDFKHDPYGAAGTLVQQAFMPMSARDINTLMQENPRAWFLAIPMLMGSSLSSDVPAKSQNWRGNTGFRWGTTKLSEQELENRQETRRLHIAAPDLGSKVMLSGRDFRGRPNYYNLSKTEKDTFDKVYMPTVTTLLNEVIHSETYSKMPEEKKSRWLERYVHMLNHNYGVATRGRAEYLKKFYAKEVEPSNLSSDEKIQELPGGSQIKFQSDEEQ